MRFRMTTDVVFDADDIDHAFSVLAQHFSALAQGRIDQEGDLFGELLIAAEKDAPQLSATDLNRRDI